MDASGADIGDGGDEFQYVYKSVSGDFMATARVTDRVDPPAGTMWGRHGIMARYTCDSSSKHSTIETGLTSPGDSVGLPRHHFRITHLTEDGNLDDYQVDDGTLAGFPGHRR